MRKADVLAYFQGNQSAVARFLKITRASVNAWDEDLIPEEQALRLHLMTEGAKGALKYDASIYDAAKGRVDPTPHSQPAAA